MTKEKNESLVLRTEIDKTFALDKSEESYREVKAFLRKNSFASSLADASKILVNFIPFVGGGLSEAINQMTPNPEMDLLIKHFEDFSTKFNALKEKIGDIEDALKDHGNRLFISQTIHESVEDEVGDKWEFYCNLLLNSLSDKELSRQKALYYKQRISELSSLELTGLANLYRNRMDILADKTKNMLEKIILKEKERLPFIVRIIAEDLIRLGDEITNNHILKKLSESHLIDPARLEDSGEHALRSAINKIDSTFNLLDEKLITFIETTSIAPVCFTPWVLEFTKNILREENA